MLLLPPKRRKKRRSSAVGGEFDEEGNYWDITRSTTPWATRNTNYHWVSLIERLTLSGGGEVEQEEALIVIIIT